MLLTVLVAIFSIVCLMIIHEFGHFIIAKKFNVKVEEFGIGLPPRLFGKKIGETIYSLNLIPFGAFVKVFGEEGGIEDARSFSDKPIWQRALIIAGGVISFWVTAAIILILLAGVWGLPVAFVGDEDQDLLDPKIHIRSVLKDSPAEEAGIIPGDIIVGFEEREKFQSFIEENKGKEIILTISRQGDVFETEPIIPRVSFPEGQGPLGVSLVKIGQKVYPWHQAPLAGLKATGVLTLNIIDGWGMAIKHFTGIEKLPEDVDMELVGPVGIVGLIGDYFNMGAKDFLFFIALIAVALALINIMPIPALDGGKLLFLAIEAVKGSPINPKIEQKITAGFFFLLIFLIILVTIGDIANIIENVMNPS